MLTLALAASLAALQPDINCDEARTQTDMNYCADQDYRRADAELNRIWPQALQRAKALDRDVGGAVAEQRLRAAQRAWIAYRDAQCEVAGLEAYRGTMEPMLVAFCLKDMTERRTNDLRMALQPQ